MSYPVSSNLPIFQNWLSTVNVAVTLTISYALINGAGGNAGSNAPFSVFSAASVAGPVLVNVVAGQTVTVTFQVPSGGGSIVNNAGGGASIIPGLTYDVEDIDWGNAG
jgi:hypothetical protein